jgi:hypothetical protein
MTIVLATLAVLANGLLAGLSVDRSVVAMPAWRWVGVRGWAAFSRRADLGNGLVLYPLRGPTASSGRRGGRRRGGSGSARRAKAGE